MPPHDGPTALEVTVVLPVRNEGAHLDAVLADVLGQEFPAERMEVLVVDGQSTDDTRARAEAAAARDPRVRVLCNPLRRSSAARALGAREARGAYVLYVDGHCRIPSRTLLRDMVAMFVRTGADCLARPQPLVATGTDRRARAVAAARTSWFGHSTASTIYDDSERPVSPVSSGAMYRRDVFERVGTFDPAFDACEDVEFNWRVERAGCSCWTSSSLAVHYEPRRTFRGLGHQMLRYGVGRARLHRKHPESFTLESLIPVAFVLGLPLASAPLWLPPPWGAALAAPYALYAVLALVAAMFAGRRAGWEALPLVAIAFPVIHSALGIGYLWGRTLGRAPREPGP